MTIHRTSGHNETLQVLLLRIGALQNAEALFAVADVPEICVHILEDLIQQLTQTLCNPKQAEPTQPQPKMMHFWALPTLLMPLKITDLYKIPMSGLVLLRKKYPVLQYFASIDGVKEQSLALLASQWQLGAKGMSEQCRSVLKIIRQFASNAESKLKKGRKLYKFLMQQQDYLTQIIMNNQQLKGLEALEHRSFEELTELQLSNNQIQQLCPLRTMRSPALQEVDLSSNHIVSLLPLNDCTWTLLSSLTLSQNRITSVQNVAFRNFNNIKTLNLSDNFITRIKHLRKEINNNLPRLKQLDLSNNSILDLHCLSECQFKQLTSLQLHNNLTPNILHIQKICLVQPQQDKSRSVSHYEIRVSTDWTRDKILLYGYRQRSRHKLSVKVIAGQCRVNRDTIQKGRKLMLE